MPQLPLLLEARVWPEQLHQNSNWTFGGIGRNIWGNEVLPEAFSEELDSIFESNLLAVRSTIAHTDVVIEDSNRHSHIGYLVKKQAEDYVFF